MDYFEIEKVKFRMLHPNGEIYPNYREDDGVGYLFVETNDEDRDIPKTVSVHIFEESTKERVKRGEKEACYRFNLNIDQAESFVKELNLAIQIIKAENNIK